jgi:hypothetical protein
MSNLNIINAMLISILSANLIIAGQIQGWVKDDKTGEPISGVQISPDGSSDQVLTDHQGYFVLNSNDIPLKNIDQGDIFEFSFTSQGLQSPHFLAEGWSLAVFNLHGHKIFEIQSEEIGKAVQKPLSSFGAGIYVAVLKTGHQVYTQPISSLRDARIYFSKKHLTANTSQEGLQKTTAPLWQLNLIKSGYFGKAVQIDALSTTLNITMSPDESDDLFNDTEILTYSFTMTTADSQAMIRHALLEEYSMAQLNLLSQNFTTLNTYQNVGLRFKGSTYTLPLCFNAQGYMPGADESCYKTSLKLKVDEYLPDQRIYSIKKLDLLAVREHSILSNKISYYLFDRMGVPSSRTAYARVYVNNNYWGLYLATEVIDGRYSKHRLGPKGDGNIYKEIWPNQTDSSETWLNDYYMDALRTNDNPEDLPNVSDMIRFANAIKNTNAATFEQDISPWLNIDNMVRYIVVDQAIKNWDGFTTWYTSSSPHNFYWMQEGPGQRFWLVPWDHDNTFVSWGSMTTPLWNVKPAAWRCQSEEDVPSGCDKLTNLMAQTQWTKFVELGQFFRQNYFNSNHLSPLIANWKAISALAAREDPTFSLDYYNWAIDQPLSDFLPQLIRDFDDHLGDSYREE